MSNPPIQEAIIDLRFPRVLDWDSAKIKEYLSTELLEYPETRVQHGWKAEFQLDQGISASSSTEHLGPVAILKRSADGQRIAHFEATRLALSQLFPYSGWKAFHLEALKLWHLYQQAMGQLEPTRLGVRFINRIDRPLAVDGLRPEDIITHVPSHPNMDPQLVRSGFVVSETYIHPTTHYHVRLIRSMDLSEPETMTAVIDIDVWTERPGISVDQLSSSMEMLREVKNEIFFASLAKKTLKDLK